MQNVDNYDAFYKTIGLKPKSLDELNDQLLQAIKNSKAKKYHGDLNEIHTLPTSNDQIRALLSKIPKIEDFYNIKQESQVDKKEYKYEISLKKTFSDEEWK